MSERFELGSELTIYTAAEVREALLKWIKEHHKADGSVMKISAKGVQAVDGAGLQLLAGLGNMSVPWQLADTSEEFTSVCRLMGLTGWLDSPYLVAQGLGAEA